MNSSLNIKIGYISLIKFTAPTIIANVFMCIYSIVDGIFVSNIIGTDALSAVNIVMPYVTIILSIGTMIGTGGSAYVAKQLGEGKMKEAKENFTMLILICFIGCTITAVLSLIFCNPLLRLLGADDAIFNYCYNYAIPLFIISPLTLLGVALQSFFITAARPALGMAFSIIGGVVNILLDWLLIAVFKFGVMGAALATSIGYSIPAVFGLIYFAFYRKGLLCFIKPKYRFKVLVKASTNGSSEMVSTLSAGLTTVMMNNIIMDICGATGVAAFSILIYAMMLLTSIYFGYAMGIAPIISFNHGAKNIVKLKCAHRINLIYIISSSIIVFLIGIPLRNSLISIFADSSTDVYSIAYNGYLIFSTCFLFMGINMYSSSLFTALGDGKTSAIISFCRGLLFLTIALYTLPYIFGLHGIFVAIPVAELLGAVLSFYYIKKYKSKYNYA